MAYEMVMPYHLHMPSYFLETFTEYPDFIKVGKSLYLPTFSFSSLSYPYYSITALILFILLILRLNNFNPLPT